MVATMSVWLVLPPPCWVALIEVVSILLAIEMPHCLFAWQTYSLMSFVVEQVVLVCLLVPFFNKPQEPGDSTEHKALSFVQT